MSNAAAVVHAPGSSGLLRAMIIAQGILTVWLSFAILPLGVVGMLTNAVLAFGSHGENRRLFAGFAIAAAIVIACLVLFLLPVSHD